MKISEVIKELEQIKDEHGDLTVNVWFTNGVISGYRLAIISVDTVKLTNYSCVVFA